MRLEILEGRSFLRQGRFFFQFAEPHDDGMQYFSVDEILVYSKFCFDFGPLNIAHVVRFFGILDDKLLGYDIICMYSKDEEKMANSLWLIGAYLVFRCNYSVDATIKILSPFLGEIKPFRDASNAQKSFPLFIEDCLSGLKKATNLGLFSFDEFNIKKYEHHEKVDNGDFNWIVKNKILALACPSEGHNSKGILGNKKVSFGFNDLVKYFKRHQIKMIIRLNNRIYEKSLFESHGIAHQDLYFPDGSNPSLKIVHQFISICEQQSGAVAVHCKAGLGRTGTLICAWLMKKYKFSAREAIGYVRIMRPGSVVGPQQEFLVELEEAFKAEEQIHFPISAHSPKRRKQVAVQQPRKSSQLKNHKIVRDKFELKQRVVVHL